MCRCGGRGCEVNAHEFWKAAEKRAEKAEAEVKRLNEVIRQGSVDALLLRDGLLADNARLRKVEAAARAIIDYQKSGEPDFPFWDARFDALEDALAEGGSK
jgi:hypothetical protein